MARATVRTISAALVLALAAPACDGGDASPPASTAPAPPTSSSTGTPGTTVTSAPSGTTAPTTTGEVPPLLDGGLVSDAAIAAVLDGDGAIDQAVLDAFAAEFAAAPLDQQETAVAELALRAELMASEVSGLEAAIGDGATTEAALTGAYEQVRSQSDAAFAAIDLTPSPAGFRSTSPAAAPPGASAGGVAAIGLFMGYLALSTFGTAIVGQSNGWNAGDTDVHEGNGVVYGASIDEVSSEITFVGTQDGVDVEFSAGTVIHPCPGPDGSFDIQAVIDVKATKGGTGQNARLELKVDGVVGDNAELASKNIENHIQWADFANASGQFIDLTMSGPTGVETTRLNRSGGKITDAFTRTTALVSTLLALMIEAQLTKAAEDAWKSGRCVNLTVTPSAGPTDLTPSQVVDVLAEPRSKVDGSPTGGTVTATLTAGASSVTPDGSPVPADANSTYTAAPEVDKEGTVAYESRSRRGVGKTSVTFTTSQPAAYLVVGGLEDWQVNMVVCDITEPFSLEAPGIGVAEFSGGLSGTYSATGIFNLSYTGTYAITLDNGLGTPGSMIATSAGTTGGEAGSGSENYVLTPATC